MVVAEIHSSSPINVGSAKSAYTEALNYAEYAAKGTSRRYHNSSPKPHKRRLSQLQDKINEFVETAQLHNASINSLKISDNDALLQEMYKAYLDINQLLNQQAELFKKDDPAVFRLFDGLFSIMSDAAEQNIFDLELALDKDPEYIDALQYLSEL